MTQRVRVFTMAVLVLFLTGLTWATEYNIDRDHSKILFKVKHLGISTVTGRFDKFSGSFTFDPKDLKSGKATAAIEAASVNTDVDKRDNHLRSADFLDVQKFPQITFVSKEVRDIQEGKFKLVGDLTLHGVTRPVVLDAELGGVIKDQRGSERSAFTASGTINRKDFGLTWSKVMETGGLVVGDNVQILLEIEGTQKK